MNSARIRSSPVESSSSSLSLASTHTTRFSHAQQRAAKQTRTRTCASRVSRHCDSHSVSRRSLRKRRKVKAILSNSVDISHGHRHRHRYRGYRWYQISFISCAQREGGQGGGDDKDTTRSDARESREQDFVRRRNIRSWTGNSEETPGTEGVSGRRPSLFRRGQNDIDSDTSFESPPLFSAEAALNYIVAALVFLVLCYTVIFTADATNSIFQLSLEFGVVAVLLVFVFVYSGL